MEKSQQESINPFLHIWKTVPTVVKVITIALILDSNEAFEGELGEKLDLIKQLKDLDCPETESKQIIIKSFGFIEQLNNLIRNHEFKVIGKEVQSQISFPSKFLDGFELDQVFRVIPFQLLSFEEATEDDDYEVILKISDNIPSLESPLMTLDGSMGRDYDTSPKLLLSPHTPFRIVSRNRSSIVIALASDEKYIFEEAEGEEDENDEHLPIPPGPDRELAKKIALQPLTVPEVDYKAVFESTYFMSLYLKTPKESPLDEIFEDLESVMPPNTLLNKALMKIKHKKDPIQAVIEQWTSSTTVTLGINFALILDACEVFKIDYDNLKFIRKCLRVNYKKTYKEIIEKSVKFIRMVNHFVVSRCTQLNTEDRTTHRGVNCGIFNNVEEGEIYRVINFQCTSQLLDKAKEFSKLG